MDTCGYGKLDTYGIDTCGYGYLRLWIIGYLGFWITAVINNSQNIWLGLTLAVLFLPHWFIPRVFKYRCPSNTFYSDVLTSEVMLIVQVLGGIKDISLFNG